MEFLVLMQLPLASLSAPLSRLVWMMVAVPRPLLRCPQLPSAASFKPLPLGSHLVSWQSSELYSLAP